MNPNYLKEHGIQIDSFSYRGFDIGFYEDTLGHQITAIWNDSLYEFGVYNTTSYKDDMKLIIDDYLDTITRFEEQPAFRGAKLEYFQNGDFRDIRLCYKGRLLKCFLVVGTVNEESLIGESVKILMASGLLEQDC